VAIGEESRHLVDSADGLIENALVVVPSDRREELSNLVEPPLNSHATPSHPRVVLLPIVVDIAAGEGLLQDGAQSVGEVTIQDVLVAVDDDDTKALF